MATEIDVGGIKFRGGKLFLIITILSSFVGILWGGFQYYQKFLDKNLKKLLKFFYSFCDPLISNPKPSIPTIFFDELVKSLIFLTPKSVKI